MARYKDAVCRLCRREGTKLFLKGDRCFSAKCGIERRAYPPGQHGQGRARFSDYGVQLREQQKVKRMYGLLEKQFADTMSRASRMKGRAGGNLLVLLE
ncbi:MAG: 30S ribosomal protein S4, partial [Deltaproteobacteria bacterium]|nr:30S ribosomal protein S4 [Deltaproteobacteria bacterium]